MKARVIAAVMAVPLLFALGCAQEESAQSEEMAAETEEQTMEAASGEMAAPVMASLEALNNSGITGTAELTHTDDALSVTISLTGLEPGAEYAAHIHSGSCEQQGPVVAPLGSLTAANDGTGTLEASVVMDQLSMMSESGMEEESGMMEEESGMMEEESGMMEEESGMMEEESGMMEEESGMMEQEHEMGYYIQVHSPDGAPVSCANVEMKGGGGHMM